MQRTITTLLDGGKFFEGARWHNGFWWVSDLYNKRVLKISETGSYEVVITVEGQPSGLGWMPDGSLLIVSMLDKRVLRYTSDRQLMVHADLSPYVKGFANDMVVDRMGRAYVGSAGFDLFTGEAPDQADLLRVDPDGAVHVAATRMDFPNGLVLSPDGSTLIVAETFGAAMTAFDVDENGDLSHRRELIRFGPKPSWETVHEMLQVDFAPDGCAIDSEGHVWVADATGNRVSRVSPKGEVVEEIMAPEGYGLYSCALGGADKQTLLLCCAPGFDRETCIRNDDGILFACKVDVPAG